MDVYKVGISLILNNGVTPGLTGITSQLIAANNAATLLNSNLARLKLAAVGAVSILGGVAIIEGFKKLVDHGKEVNNQLERMKIAGMNYKEIQEAIAAAQKTSSAVLTTTYSENLKHMLELRYAFGETSGATKHIEEVSRANMILNAMKGGGKDQVWEFVKSLEGKGLTFDPAQFSSYLNTMTKVVEATGGRVDPAMFYNTFKYGRTATQLWDEGFVGGALPRLIQEMSGGGGGGGAGGPGNALMTGFAKLVQGQLSKASGQELEFLKLGKATGIKGAGTSLTGNIPSSDLFAKNPYEWTQQVLGPALKNAGIDMSDTVKVAQHVQKLFGVRTISDAVMKMLLQGRFMEGENAPFEKDIRLQKGAMEPKDAAKELANNHYATALASFNAQWSRLLETIGSPATDVAARVLGTLASGLSKLSEVAAAHPEGIKIALEMIAALAGSLIVAGIIALGTAVAGLVGVGGILVALAAGLAALAAMNWEAIKSSFTNIGPKILEALKAAAALVVGGIPGIFVGIGSAILGALKNAVSGALGGLGNPNGAGQSAPGVGAAGASPMNYRVPAPPSRNNGHVINASLHVDGQKLGKIAAKYITRSGNGPIEGSVYPDATRLALRNDTSYVT